MKTFKSIIVVLIFAMCYQCTHLNSEKKTPQKIQVGVFEGHGGAQTCIWEAVEAIKIDPEMSVRTFTTSDIANNVLDSLDAIIIPGGGGSRQFINIGAANQQRIREFVAKGKGAVGTCAGAYFFSSTPDYSCMWMNGQQAIDIEHDNRGHGISKFTLTPEGKKLFPELANRDTCFVMYYEGPVFVKNEKDSIPSDVMAIMESDVHEEGDAPANMTNNKPFFVANRFGKGCVFCSIAHPEATPGMQWMIPRMIRWTLNLPIKEYNAQAVNPNIFNQEILMTKEDLTKEENYTRKFIKGSSADKLEALQWMQQKNSWEAKRYIQSMLYDADPEVRVRAAQYISEVGYLRYLPDMKAAYHTEKELVTKEKIRGYLDKLHSMLP